jgi:hypothetical protein
MQLQDIPELEDNDIPYGLIANMPVLALTDSPDGRPSFISEIPVSAIPSLEILTLEDAMQV